MAFYRVFALAGGTGFKVQVTTLSDGLRIIGIFKTEAEADGWIARDRQRRPAGHADQFHPSATGILPEPA